MAIGSSSRRRSVKKGAFLALVFASLSVVVQADDQIVKKDGSVVNGQITGVSGGQISYSTGNAKLVIYLSDVKSVTMATPAAVTQLKGASPTTITATLAPLLRQFAGLPSDWVTTAMAQLADAYDAEGKADLASATYAQINQLYPNSSYQYVAAAGSAKLLLQQGKIPDALALVKPIVDKANQDIAPSGTDGLGYASAFLVYGQALQAQKQYPQALEAYLTVKTMFYQNPTQVDQAEQLVKALRAQAPGVGVD